MTGFFENQCLIRAAALTFHTFLSIVPLWPVAFSISKGFGIQNTEFVRGLLAAHQGIAPRWPKTHTVLHRQPNVKTLGWLGVITLLVTVFSMVGDVEKAFNTIWGVRAAVRPGASSRTSSRSSWSAR